MSNDFTTTARPIDTHITIVGALHVAFGIMALIGLAFAFLGMIGFGFAMAQEGHGLMGTVVGVMIVSVLALFAIPGLIGGIGLLMKKRWARIVVLILSFLHLINIPFGTALGAYSIWVLLQDDARYALTG